MAICWLSGIALNWAPILTFERRRNEVLEWVEENLDPVAFHDGKDTLGLAFGEPDARLVLGKRHMILSSGASGISMEETLGPALDGVLGVLSPSRLQIQAMSYRVSAAIGALDYGQATEKLALRGSFLDATTRGLRPRDVAVLADVEDDGLTGQVEFGVVHRDELSERVFEPGMGRIDAFLERPRLDVLKQRIDIMADDVSVFLDAMLTPSRMENDVTAMTMWDEHGRASEKVLQLVTALAAGLVRERGEGT